MDDHEWDERAEFEPPEGRGPAPWAERSDEAPSPGERLLYALGQLYRLFRRGELAVHPADVDIPRMARLIGVLPSLEYVQENRTGRHYHFCDEVLHADPTREFPWRLLSIWEWADQQELDALWSDWPD
jgi:hypothetical protein